MQSPWYQYQILSPTIFLFPSDDLFFFRLLLSRRSKMKSLQFQEIRQKKKTSFFFSGNKKIIIVITTPLSLMTEILQYIFGDKNNFCIVEMFLFFFLFFRFFFFWVWDGQEFPNQVMLCEIGKKNIMNIMKNIKKYLVY